MNCPNCQAEFKQVKSASVNAGFSVIFEQCPDCGGLWFDRFEMVQITSDEALKIDTVNEQTLIKPIEENEDLFCPKDKIPLVKITDINIPEDTSIGRCRHCEGVWMNRGEFIKYKQHVELRQKENEEFGKKYNIFGSTKLRRDDRINRKRQDVVNHIGSQLMPLPVSIAHSLVQGEDQPFILSDQGVELLKDVSQADKIKIYQAMAREHQKDVATERNFASYTVSIVNIILKLLIKVK